MPDMMEIYKQYAANYDELVLSEDYTKNIDRFLFKNLIWDNKIVYEAGIGTGRITKIYIDKITRVYGFDRELHMLNKCKVNLCNYLDKVFLEECENIDLKIIQDKVDIFIEGWSFGHIIIENKNNFQLLFDRIYSRLCQIVRKNGTIVLLETFGTNVCEPKVPDAILGDFYNYIEKKFQFKRNLISTDYKFKDYTEAARIMGFFFGSEMSDEIIRTKKNIITEFTGIWIRENE